jgi:hypothetical protein
MSLSPKLEDLLRAARDDAPPEVVRDAVWDRVVEATSVSSVAAAAAKGVGFPTSLKLVSLGAVIGAAAAGLAVLTVSSTDIGEPTSTHRSPAFLATGHLAGARLSESAPRRRRLAQAMKADSPAPVDAASPLPSAADQASSLAEEARLVTEARAALVRGEPARALVLVRSTSRLPARALEPEELVLETRALRALGRADEALAAELTLRRRFPGHALSR